MPGPTPPQNPPSNINNQNVTEGIGTGGFFSVVVGTAAWVEVPFLFTSGYQIIINDSANPADISWDQFNPLTTKVKHAEVRTTEVMKFDRRIAKSLFVKNTGGGVATLRIMAW